MRQPSTALPSSPRRAPRAAAPNPFAGAADALGLGVDALFNTAEQFAPVALDLIAVRPQVREVFEDDANTLAELTASIQARGVLQPILVRIAETGYELVAGERRLRAARLAGLSTIPAYIRDLTDEEAEDAQLAENIQRLNLSQIEEARKIQRDLDHLGSVEAVLAKHHKSHAWLSKTLALLSLPAQAKRLVTENVSADVEVINTVKTIERTNPEAARQLVDDLKATRGRASARAQVAAVKARVKPGKRDRDAGVGPTPKKNAPPGRGGAAPSVNGSDVDQLLAALGGRAGRKKLEVAIAKAHADGKASQDVAADVLRGLRTARFADAGAGALSLAAFLRGALGHAPADLSALAAALPR